MKMEETPSDFNPREPYKIFYTVSLSSIKESSSSSENLKLCFSISIKSRLKLFVKYY
jgi:hypothetical protein